MPLYALDGDSQIISATLASSHVHYLCIECKGRLKKRVGRERRPHFYHLLKTPQCRLYSKNIDHLTLQMELKEKNPSLVMERPFPSLLRIADLCWEEHKLVLEIQCSPITPLEIEERTADYRREGYTTVWLLDDRLYNKRLLRAGEGALRKMSCYFFSLKGGVYDQFEILIERKRVASGPPLFVDLSLPKPLPLLLPKTLTQQLTHRKASTLFRGDLFDRALLYPRYLEGLIEHETSILAHYKKESRLLHWIKKGFYIGLEYLVRQSCQH